MHYYLVGRGVVKVYPFKRKSHTGKHLFKSDFSLPRVWEDLKDLLSIGYQGVKNLVKMVKYALVGVDALAERVEDYARYLTYKIRLSIFKNSDEMLESAIKSRHSKTIKAVLNAEGDVNARIFPFNQTPLIYCAQRNDLETAQVLLERKDIDLYATSEAGYTALTSSVHLEETKMVKMLLTAILNAGGDVNAKMFPPVIIKGRDDLNLNRTLTSFNETALMYFAKKCDFKTVQELLARKDINLHAKNKAGHTALINSARLRNPKMVKMLFTAELNAGHDVNARMFPCNETPLLYFAQEGDLEIVQEILARRDVNIDAKNRLGYTALSASARLGFHKMVKMLLDHDANADTSNWHGMTALMLAAEKGSLDIVCDLLKLGADVNLVDNSGNTALFLSKKFGHNNVTDAISQHGASNPKNLLLITNSAAPLRLEYESNLESSTPQGRDSEQTSPQSCNENTFLISNKPSSITIRRKKSHITNN